MATFVRSMRELRDWSVVRTRRRVGGAVEVTSSQKGCGQLSRFSTGVFRRHFSERR